MVKLLLFIFMRVRYSSELVFPSFPLVSLIVSLSVDLTKVEFMIMINGSFIQKVILHAQDYYSWHTAQSSVIVDKINNGPYICIVFVFLDSSSCGA